MNVSLDISKLALPLLMLGLVATMAWAAGHQASFPYFVYASWAMTGAMGWAWWKGRFSVAQVLAFGLLFRLMLLPVMPALSDDAFRYIWDGWLQLHGINPFKYVPSDSALASFHALDLYARLNSPSYFGIYPPVSQVIFAFAALFYPLGWQVSYLIIKVLFLVVEGLGVWKLSQMVSARSLLLYAWNPLILMEVAGQPHNEALLASFLLLTVWALQAQKGAWALVWMTCAVWTKLFPVLLMPFVLNRVGWRKIWIPILVGMLWLLPYWHEAFIANVQASLALYTKQFEFGAGLYYWLKYWGISLVGHEESKVLGPFLQRVFLLAIGVLWLSDLQKRRSFPEIVVLFIGLFLLTATTVHPWYFVGLMAMLPFLADDAFQDVHEAPQITLKGLEIPAWHWYWLGMMMTGNYLFYLDGSQWRWVVGGWLGWLIILIIISNYKVLQQVQFSRAGKKWTWLKMGFLPAKKEGRAPYQVLDLGAGEGYLGEWVKGATGSEVTLADVVNFNKTQLPFVRYDGITLPFEENAFDVTILSFVLHHCQDPSRVFAEVCRVTRHRILILESVYETERDLKRLTFLDTFANRLRSGGLMNAQEEHLSFKKISAWLAFFKPYPVKVVQTDEKGLFIHQQALFVLDKTQTTP